jgi:O-succinylbenzoate synthase
VRAFAIPLRTRFRRTDVREGVLLAGACGWGEWSPFPEYPAPVAARWLAAAREAADTPWPAPLRDTIPVNVTVPAVAPEAARQIVAASGCMTAKVKVAEPGQTFSDDLVRVAVVRDALGPSGKLRLDANGAWTVDEAVPRLRRLSAFDLEYAEQPVATLEQMAALRRRVSVPLAVDEVVRLAVDPTHIAGLAEAADVVVLKAQPLGGVWPALRVAEACGLPVVVSSALETSVGIAAGLALAAALPELPYACGLATVQLLTADVVAESLVPLDGAIAVRRPDVDEQRLAAVELTGENRVRWQRRLAAAEKAAT